MNTGLCSYSAILLQFILVTPAYSSELSPLEESAVFETAGYKKTGSMWHSECSDTSDPNFSAAAIESIKDINGDNLPEVVITEGSYQCYGNAGTAFKILSKQANNSWKLILSATGIPKFLNSKNGSGWPDIEIGGPGFCFPVMSWSAKGYVISRNEYEGKECKY